MVLVADRHRSGAAPSHRFWFVDLHGGELGREPAEVRFGSHSGLKSDIA
jgi:hypothetical protein